MQLNLINKLPEQDQKQLAQLGKTLWRKVRLVLWYQLRQFINGRIEKLETKLKTKLSTNNPNLKEN